MNNNHSILIVEDEPNLGETLQEYLHSKGYHCHWVDSCKGCREFLSQPQNIPHVVLMDIGLPDGNGIELAGELKKSHPQMVLIFLSALNDPEIRVQGLELGGQDYITKPFNLKELTLRLERILSSIPRSKNEEPLEFGQLKFWPSRYEVEDAQGNHFNIGQKECAILQLLLELKDQVVSRDQIIDQVWGEESYPSHRTVDNYIVRLRKWSETDPNDSLKIYSIRGVGYKLTL